MASNSGSLNVEIKVKDGVSKPIADAEKAVGKLEQSFNNLNNSVKTLEKVRSALNGIREVDKLSFGSKESIRDVEKMITILAKYEKALVAHQKGSKKLSDDQFGLLTDQATRYAKSLQEIGAAAQKMQGEIAKAGEKMREMTGQTRPTAFHLKMNESIKATIAKLEELKRREAEILKETPTAKTTRFASLSKELRDVTAEIIRTKEHLRALEIAKKSAVVGSSTGRGTIDATGIWAKGDQITKQNELLARQRAFTQELEKEEQKGKSLLSIFEGINKVLGTGNKVSTALALGKQKADAQQLATIFQGMNTTLGNAASAASQLKVDKQKADAQQLIAIFKQMETTLLQVSKSQEKAAQQRAKELNEAQSRLKVITSQYNRLQEIAGRSNKTNVPLNESLKNAIKQLKEMMRLYNGIIANKGRAFEGKNVYQVTGYQGSKFETNRVYREQERALREHEKAQQKAAQEAEKHARSQQKLSLEMAKTNDIANKMKSVLGNLFPAAGLRQTLLGIIEIGGEFQKQHMALQSIVGDVGQANALFENLKTLSIDSPFTFLDFSKSAKQLAAFSTPYNELYDTTRRLADVSAGLGVDMSRLIYAYGQTRSTEALNAKELRMFAYAGIPMLNMISQQLSEVEGRAVSTGETFKRITRREIGFESVKKVFEDLTNEGGMFYNMQGTLMESLWGKWMKMLDVLQLFQSEVADSPVGSIMGVFIDSMTAALRHTNALVWAGFALAGSWAVLKVRSLAMVAALGTETAQMYKNLVASNAKKRVLISETMSYSALTQAERINIATKGKSIGTDLQKIVTAEKLNLEDIRRLATKRKLTHSEEQYIMTATRLNAIQLQLYLSGNKLTITQYKQLAAEGKLTKERVMLMLATGRLTLAEGMQIRELVGLNVAQIKTAASAGSLTYAQARLAYSTKQLSLWQALMATKIGRAAVMVKYAYASMKAAASSFLPFLAVTAIVEGVVWAVNALNEKSEKLEENAKNASEALLNIEKVQANIKLNGESLLDMEKRQVSLRVALNESDVNTILGAIDQISEELKSRLGGAYNSVVQTELNEIILKYNEDYRKSLEEQVILLERKLRVLKETKDWELRNGGFDIMGDANYSFWGNNFDTDIKQWGKTMNEFYGSWIQGNSEFWIKAFDEIAKEREDLFMKDGKMVLDLYSRYKMLMGKAMTGEVDLDDFSQFNAYEFLKSDLSEARREAEKFVDSLVTWVQTTPEALANGKLSEKAKMKIQADMSAFIEEKGLPENYVSLLANGYAKAKLGIELVPEKVETSKTLNNWQTRLVKLIEGKAGNAGLKAMITADVDYIKFFDDLRNKYDDLNKRIQSQSHKLKVEYGIELDPKMDSSAIDKALEKLNRRILVEVDPGKKEYLNSIKSELEKLQITNELFESENQDPNKNNNNNNNGSGSKTDKWLQNFKKEISLFEKYVQAYEKLVKKYGETQALLKLNELEEFASIRDKGYDPSKPAEAYRKMAKDPNLLKTKERRQVKAETEIKGENAETDEALEAIADAVKEFKDTVAKNTKAWENYEKLLKVTGDTETASKLAFGTGVLPAQEKDRIKKILSENDKVKAAGGFEAVLKMSDRERKNKLGGESEEYGMFEEFIKLDEKDKQKITDTLVKALEDAMSLDKITARINLKRDETVNAIENSGLNSADKKNAIDNANKKADQEIAKETWNKLSKSPEYVEVFADLGNMSMKAISGLYDKIVENRAGVSADGDSLKALIDALNKLREAMVERNPYKSFATGFSGFGLIKAVKDRGGLIKTKEEAHLFGLKEGTTIAEGDRDEAYKSARTKVVNTFMSGMEGISEQFAALQDILGPVTELFDQLGNSTMSDIFETGSKAFGSATSVAGGFSTLKTSMEGTGLSKFGSFLGKAGPYAAMAGFALSLTTSILALHDKAIQKEIDASKQRQKEMDTLSKNLKKDLEDTLGGIFKYSASSTDMNKIKANWDNLSSSTKNQFNEAQREGNNYFDASLTSLMAQRDEAERQLELEKSKKKKDDSAIKDAEQSLRELDNEVKNFAKDLADSLYGIDFKDWAGKLADALTDAWMSGENAALAYKNTVANILKELGVSVMTQKILEPLLEPLMGRFFNQFEADNGKLTDKGMHIIGEMYNLGNKAKDGVYAYLDGLDQIDKQHGGNGLRESSASSLSSGIKSITEETAGLLASYVNSIRADVAVLRTLTEKQQIVLDSLPELNVIAKSQLTQLNNIATFTRRNAEATEEIRTTLGRITYASTNGYKVRI